MNEIIHDQSRQNSAGIPIKSQPRGTLYYETKDTFSEDDDEEPFVSLHAVVHIRSSLHVLREKPIGCWRRKKCANRLLNNIGYDKERKLSGKWAENRSDPYSYGDYRSCCLEIEKTSQKRQEDSVDAKRCGKRHLRYNVDHNEQRQRRLSAGSVCVWGVDTIKHSQKQDPHGELSLHNIIDEEGAHVDSKIIPNPPDDDEQKYELCGCNSNSHSALLVGLRTKVLGKVRYDTNPYQVHKQIQSTSLFCNVVGRSLRSIIFGVVASFRRRGDGRGSRSTR